MTIEFSPSKGLRAALVDQIEHEVRLHEDREALEEDVRGELEKQTYIEVGVSLFATLRLGVKSRTTPCVVEEVEVNWDGDGTPVIRLKVYAYKTNGEDLAAKHNFIGLSDVIRLVEDEDDLTTWAETYPWTTEGST